MNIFYIVLDAVLLAIIVFTVIKSIKEGFVQMVLGFFKVLIAFIIALSFTSPLATHISDKYIMRGMAENVSNAVSSVVASIGDSVDLESAVPEIFTDMATNAGIDMHADVYEPVEQVIAKGGENVAEAISAVILAPVSRAISSILAFILIFLASLVGLTLLIWILDLLCKLPVLHMANKVLGCLFGIIYAVICAWFFARGAVFVLDIISANCPELISSFDISNTYVLRFFYEVNPLSFVKFDS